MRDSVWEAFVAIGHVLSSKERGSAVMDPENEIRLLTKAHDILAELSGAKRRA